MNAEKVQQTALQQMFVKAVRETGKNNAEIALAIGTSRQYVSELMNGWVHGSLPMWESVLSALDIEIGYRHAPAPLGSAPIDQWELVEGGPEKRFVGASA